MTDDRNTSPATRSASPETDRHAAEQAAIAEALGRVKHKILVLSGKGGVGKSTVAANLAVSFASAHRKVGLLDVDIHGPSIPKILNLEGCVLQSDGVKVVPAEVNGGLRVMSIAFLLQSPDDAVIWRGPLKYQVIKEFILNVDWGDLDYLIVDSPPGTGDEPLSVAQLLGPDAGALVVTTPQALSVADVRRSITFCQKVGLKMLGVIENMSGFVCPKCGEKTDIFGSGGGEAMARDMNVPYLGSIPIDPAVVHASDNGTPYVKQYPHSPTALAFREVIASLVKLEE